MFRFFERLVDPFPNDDRTPPAHSMPAFIAFYARPVWKLLIVTAVLTAASSVIEVSLYGFLGHIVDWFAAGDRAHFLANNAWQLVGMALVVLVLLPALVFGQGLTTFQAMAPNVPMRFRWQVHRWLLSQSLPYFQDDFAGRIASKMMQTALAIREVMMKFVDVLLYVAVYFGGVVILVAGADWRLALPFAGWLAGYIALLKYFLPRLQDISEAQANARAEMTGRIVDAYTNIGTVKLFAHTERESDYARASMRSFLSTVYTQMRRINGFYASLYLLNASLLFAVTGLGIVFWTERAITAGAVATAVGLVLQINGMSQWIMWEVSNLFEHVGTIRDGMASFTRNRAIADAPDAKPLRVTAGAIDFERVAFHYGRDDAGVIADFSLRIQAGEKIGLVGRSGAGKSTLLALLLRFHELEAGRIAVDGQDITDVTQASLREAIGMVSQDTALLHRSIADNIRYGKPEASDDELWAAIDAAHAGFIRDLVDNRGRRGLDAHVGERGVKLSGGQRQRVALARVMLKNAPILLLDEATAALDSEIEAAITDNLHRIMRGKTVIAVAHRLSTIAELDRLVVIDGGAIVETGTHRELLDRDGLYARLWSMQSGGFLAETITDEPGPA